MLELTGPGEGIYKEKGSKFIGYAFPVKNEAELKQRMAQLKNEHHQARHHCYAFVVGKNREHQRWSDAGEPSNTAGPPIHGQILSAGLTNTAVVVVRYFGGTKLGKPGLIKAYKEAAADALKNATSQPFVAIESYRLSFPYAATSQVMQVLHKADALIREQEYGEKTILVVDIPEAMAANALTLLDHVEALSISPEKEVE